MKDFRKSVCGKFYKIFNFFKYKGVINVFWYSGINFGDGLNPYFISKISGKKCNLINPDRSNTVHYIVIGSSIDQATSKSIIWGAGYISEDCTYISKPRKVCAVRGPKTRKKLLEEGVECPEVYGDPALLLPKIYNPKIKHKYKLGIIPHYVDQKNDLLEKFRNNPSIKIIDIKRCNPYNVIDDVLECEKIASSSLHGIILADAYGIPSTWIEFSEKVVGNGFKFYDYFLSVGRDNEIPLKITKDIDLNHILNTFKAYKIDIDFDKLIDSCPFKIKI